MAGIHQECRLVFDNKPGTSNKDLQDALRRRKPLSESSAALVTANNEFAFKLYAALGGTDSMFFSPTSLLTAWAMVREGALGETATEIDEILLPLANDVRRESFKELCERTSGQAQRPYELRMANALWARSKASEEFMKTICNTYRGEFGAIDVARINAWGSKHTNGKIPEMVPPTSITALTRFILTNAVYFKGTWVFQFPAENTREQDFRTDDGRTTSVQMMHLKSYFNYGESDGVQVLELPYVGKDLAMELFLPRCDVNSKPGLDAQRLSKLHENADIIPREVDVILPRFKLNTSYELIDVLRKMGLVTAFSPAADFSGINNGLEPLFVDKVLHSAFVETNEKGTKAAAATSIIGATLGASHKPIQFIADHPFVFAIVERASGNILFLGRLSNPIKA
ncbi:TPA: serpin family protein [Candidatus Micrarchaeota archaeon]|nr:serpin family protein [Candidatus Micrarchaeota archaeon]